MILAGHQQERRGARLHAADVLRRGAGAPGAVVAGESRLVGAAQGEGGAVMARWLVTGAAGMLGREVADLLAATAMHEVTALGRAELDITDPAALKAALDGADVVVNAPAWTDADGAESSEAQATP